MKKIATALLVLYFTNLYAQLPTVAEYQQQENAFWSGSITTIKPVNRPARKGGGNPFDILYDKVMPLAGLFTYNETDNNVTHANHFKQALSEMYRASGNTKFESAETLFNRVDITTTTVPVGILNTTFSYLNYTPENPSLNGLTLVDNVYKPIAGKASYTEKHITLITPLKMLITTTTGNVTFTFNMKQWYNYGAKNIKTLTAKFDNGNEVPYTVIQNGQLIQNNFTVNYAKLQETKALTFIVTYTDNSTLTTYAGISVGSKPNLITAKGVSGLTTFTSKISDPNATFFGKLEYRTFYGINNSDNKLRKPFIIVDGFDPGDTRKIVVDDCTGKCQEDNKPFDPIKYQSISKLMEYNNSNSDLKKQLTDLNYDVVIVNFPNYDGINGGADDIFRNGRTVASLIQDINSQLTTNGSSEKLVLVGPSMGGQITRYALVYMEKKQQETGNPIWNHNTRLWLSMDSPHQGASIPLAVSGDLYFLGELAGDEGAKSKYRNSINSPAGRQMLMCIATGGSNFYNNEHSAYISQLKANGISGSNGYPVLNGIRKIAIANGSLTGVKNVTPSSKFYEVAAFAKVRFLGIKVDNKPVFRINNWFMPDTNTTSMLVENYKYVAKKDPIQINWSLTNSLSFGSLDAVPGGSFNSAQDVRKAVKGSLDGTNAFSFPLATPLGIALLNVGAFSVWTGKNLKIDQRIPVDDDSVKIAPQSFIPSHSALDTSGFSNWYQPIKSNLVCTSQTPFDSYYGESTNAEHITFTENMVNWLMNELDTSNSPPIAQAPSFPLNQNTLIGKSTICANNTETYNFEDVCSVPSEATWSVSSNLQVISSYGYRVIVNGLSNGAGTLTATFQNGQQLTKSIQVGSNIITNPGVVIGQSPVSSNEISSFSYSGEANATTFRWFIYGGINDGNGPEGGAYITSYQQGGRIVNINTGSIPGTLVIAVEAVNECDIVVDTSFMFVEVTNSMARLAATSSSSTITTFPNPLTASNELQVNVVKITATTATATKVPAIATDNQVKIYDLQGNLKYSSSFKTDSMLLKNVNLKEGLHILNVSTNAGEQLRTIIIVK